VSAEKSFGSLVQEIGQLSERSGTQVVGINGCQGSGKSTLADYLCTRISYEFNVISVPLSLDDFYLTKVERQQLGRDIHPLLATRGVPGTHDIQLALNTINDLKCAKETHITRFDKSIDDRADISDSDLVQGPAGLIVIEGWCFGATAVTEADLKDPINSLERDFDADGSWRRYINQSLDGDYQKLFNCVDRSIMLAAPSFDQVHHWRLEQEQKLINKLKLSEQKLASSNIMNEAQIAKFIAYFERITRHCLHQLPTKVDHLYRLNKDRSINS
jgi:D-glycerate 3-kinase